MLNSGLLLSNKMASSDYLADQLEFSTASGAFSDLFRFVDLDALQKQSDSGSVSGSDFDMGTNRVHLEGPPLPGHRNSGSRSDLDTNLNQVPLKTASYKQSHSSAGSDLRTGADQVPLNLITQGHGNSSSGSDLDTGPNQIPMKKSPLGQSHSTSGSDLDTSLNQIPMKKSPLSLTHTSPGSDFGTDLNRVHSNSSSGSDFALDPTRVSLNPAPAKGKIRKRKPRPSKRSPTKVIMADAANFRQMVQHVTGVRLAGGQIPAAPILKPEPQRLMASRVQGWLPMLDTSEFLLDGRYEVAGRGSEAVADGGRGGGAVVDGFLSFPTLESWQVM